MIQEIPREFYSVLIKTLIGHTSSWGEIETYLRQVFRDTIPTTKIKDGIEKIIGFEISINNRADECEVNRASIIGFGSLERNKHIYMISQFHLPFQEERNVKKIDNYFSLVFTNKCWKTKLQKSPSLL
ncbi:MAG: hypothetical protein U5K69_26355 [Balneolaceae bacterium]|nr:hypothetical protein [Balneolaceae bacterium]